MKRFLVSLFAAIALMAAVSTAHADVREVLLPITIANGGTAGSANLQTSGTIVGIYTDFPASMTGTQCSVTVKNSAAQTIGTMGNIGVTDGFDIPSPTIPVAGSLWSTWTVTATSNSTEAAARSITMRVLVEY